MDVRTCRFGAKDCMVLQGTRALEICLDCKMLQRGQSLESGEDLYTPLHYVAKPQAKVIQMRRKA